MRAGVACSHEFEQPLNVCQTALAQDGGQVDPVRPAAGALHVTGRTCGRATVPEERQQNPPTRLLMDVVRH